VTGVESNTFTFDDYIITATVEGKTPVTVKKGYAAVSDFYDGLIYRFGTALNGKTRVPVLGLERTPITSYTKSNQPKVLAWLNDASFAIDVLDSSFFRGFFNLPPAVPSSFYLGHICYTMHGYQGCAAFKAPLSLVFGSTAKRFFWQVNQINPSKPESTPEGTTLAEGVTVQWHGKSTADFTARVNYAFSKAVQTVKLSEQKGLQSVPMCERDIDEADRLIE